MKKELKIIFIQVHKKIRKIPPPRVWVVRRPIRSAGPQAHKLVLSNQPKEPVRRVETAAGLAGIVVS
jgi:hypothetical protein